ncbi:unnamed protein product [Lactuca virosa]|uniref:Uncharacterized protein n=1 Tax=Lactuca virosa TaxID=75947 RepID=A0AAU9M2F4_9ASTR|nr:unnamed protein product [Lactuca virosa]
MIKRIGASTTFVEIALSSDIQLDIISLAAIKSGGGPSPGGKGHEFPGGKSLGNNKNSGPSPVGKGHEFTNDKIFSNIKNSGPSPGGKGHGFRYAESFGNIKNSGPSSGGKGHEFTTVKIHSKIKITGRRGGEKGHDFPSSVETLGNILNSGPRWGGKVDTVVDVGALQGRSVDGLHCRASVVSDLGVFRRRRTMMILCSSFYISSGRRFRKEALTSLCWLNGLKMNSPYYKSYLQELLYVVGAEMEQKSRENRVELQI